VGLIDRLAFIRSALFLLPLLASGKEAPAQSADIKKAISLNKEGEKLLQQANFLQAAEVFAKMLDAAGDHSYGRAVALYYLGRAWLEVSEYDRALDYLEKAGNIFSELGKENEKGMSILTQARLFAERGDFRRSQELARSAEGILTRFKNHDGLFALFATTAVVQSLWSDANQALECLRVAEEIAKNLHDPRYMGFLHNTKGLVYARANDFVIAIKHCEAAADNFTRYGNAKGKGMALNNLGFICECKGDYSDAVQKYEESLRLAESTQDPGSRALALNNIGNVNRLKADYTASLKQYEESLKIREERGVRHHSAETTNNIGLVRMALGDYKEAFECFSRAYKTCTEIAQPSGRGWALHNLAFLIKDMGEWSNALQHFQTAIWLAERGEEKRILAAATMRLGQLYEYFGLFEEAGALIQRALASVNELGDQFAAGNALLALAANLTRAGKFSEAETAFKHALEQKRRMGTPIVETLCLLALFYLERGRYAPEAARDGGQEPGVQPGDHAEAGRRIAQAETSVPDRHLNDRMLLGYAKAKHALAADIQASIREFSRLKQLSKQCGSERFAFLASTGLGLAYERQQEISEARDEFTNAVAYIERAKMGLDAKWTDKLLDGEQVLGLKNAEARRGLERLSR
jgi:tetratricopeptide (TPR) repeat protein